MSVVLLTNNPLLSSLARDQRLDFVEAGPRARAMISKSGPLQKALCVRFDADANPVLITARDCIHKGWSLLHHPLYGNYRPQQQPYRSLILAPPAPDSVGPDMASLNLIEEALLVYSDNKALAPAEAPASLLDACALLDYELMRLPLEQSGAFPEGCGRLGLPEQREELSKNCA